MSTPPRYRSRSLYPRRQHGKPAEYRSFYHSKFSWARDHAKRRYKEMTLLRNGLIIAALLFLLQPYCWAHYVTLSWGQSTWSYGVYSPSQSYSVGDYAVYGFSLYQSTIGSNLGNEPDTNPSDWTQVDTINGYNVYRVSAYGGTYQLLANTGSASTTSYSDYTVQALYNYQYVVTATTASGGQSQFSSPMQTGPIPSDAQSSIGQGITLNGVTKK